MSFYYNTINNGKQFWILSTDKEYGWYYNDKHIVLPMYNPKEDHVTFAIGSQYVVVNGITKKHDFHPYDNLTVYSFEGDLVWDIGEIARNISHRSDRFYYAEILTKDILSEPKWFVLFGSCTLYDDHEYLTAYDGGNQWLFDITDRKFLKEVFTH